MSARELVNAANLALSGVPWPAGQPVGVRKGQGVRV